MKSIFDSAVRAEIIQRIDALTTDHKPLWGEMMVAQMVRHCSLCEAYYLGDIHIAPVPSNRDSGKRAIEAILKDENSTLQKNAPTSKPFVVKETLHDLESEKATWKSLIERYGTFNSESFSHWFFGPLTKDQLGQFIYKHCDHHLTQFGS